MKFLLIGGRKALENTRKMMLEEARKYFDTVLSVPLDKIRIECVNGENKVYYKHQDLSQFDVCYLRVFASDFPLAEIVLDVLGSTQVYIPTCVEAFQICNHKYYTVKVLSEVGIPVPTTLLSATPESSLSQIHKIGFPVVVKLLSGFGGKGVMLLNSETEFKPVLDTLNVFKEFICTQEFLPNKGADVRYYVLGDEVLAVRRKAAKGEWRANISRGGSAQIIETDEKMKETALKSAKLLGLDICAVDFIETGKGFRVVEVNFTPGPVIKFFGGKIVKKIVKTLYHQAVKRRED